MPGFRTGVVAAIAAGAPPLPDTQDHRVDIAISRGEQEFGGLNCPVLAIYADPHSFGNRFRNNPTALKAAQSKDDARTSAQADAFQKGNSQATVLRIKGASQVKFRSNEAEVLRAMDAYCHAAMR